MDGTYYSNFAEVRETESEIILDFKFKEADSAADIAKVVINLATAQQLYEKLRVFARESSLSSTRPRVLVVEDNDDYRKEIVTFLSENKFDVAGVPNGDAAVKMVKKFKPDAILMDHIMPVLNGLDAARIIKQNPDNSSIKIFLLLGYGKVTDFPDLMGGTIYKLLQKPLSLTELHKELNALS